MQKIIIIILGIIGIILLVCGLTIDDMLWMIIVGFSLTATSLIWFPLAVWGDSITKETKRLDDLEDFLRGL